MTGAQSKPELRKTAREKRKALAAAMPDFAARLAAHAAALEVAPGAVVGGYHALGNEADPGLLLARLVAQGCPVAFPRVAAKDAALVFHAVPDGGALQPGAYGIFEPQDYWPMVTPTILLVPLLAFDAEGYRLGYGGGYYDRTLHSLQAFTKPRAIGVAFAGQMMDFLPRLAHDYPLDAVVTELGVRHFR